jgi:polyisoprenoid-binding protein YceI
MRTETWRLATALLALVVGPSFAQERVITLDATSSRIEFLLPATGHDVHGSFAFEGGELRWDPETGVASGELVVRAGAGESGNERRDKTMHRKVLESGLYPRFVMRVERVEGDLIPGGDNALTLEGVLSIHGSEHPVRWPLNVQVTGEQFEATGSLDVPYVEWGLHDPSMLFLRVAGKVDVRVIATGTIAPAGSQTASHSGQGGVE